MSYFRRLVCLAASKKPGGLCVAGREITNQGWGSWVRPVSERATGEVNWTEYSFANNESPKLLDVIDIPFLGPVPHGHQSENEMIDPVWKWRKVDQVLFEQLWTIGESPFSLWTNRDSTKAGEYNCISPDIAAAHERSLYIIEVNDFLLRIRPHPSTGKRIYMGEFHLGRHRYCLSVTDPTVRSRYKMSKDGDYNFGNYGKVYLTISLTERYEGDGQCHKLVAAVLTNPPQ